MSTYKIRLSNAARKDLDRLLGSRLERISQALTDLSQEPGPQGSKMLRGGECAYRIRVGDYRVIYEIDDHDQVLTILRVKHRREAYR